MFQDEWFGRLEETIHGAKRLITSHEGYLWKRGQVVKAWKRRYFALSKGWLFYFEEQFHCNKFKSIAFFSEAFFNQAFRLYVKGSIPLHQTTIQKVDAEKQEKMMEKAKTKAFNDQDQVQGYSANELSEREFVFKILTEKREFQFATETESDLKKWFKAFHSTHAGDEEAEESEMTSTRDQEESGDGEEEYDEELMVGINRNATDLIDSDGDGASGSEVEVVEVEEEEKLESPRVSSKERPGHRGSKTPLMDIVDPKGTGKWIDIESEMVEKQQSNALRDNEPENELQVEESGKKKEKEEEEVVQDNGDENE